MYNSHKISNRLINYLKECVITLINLIKNLFLLCPKNKQFIYHLKKNIINENL